MSQVTDAKPRRLPHPGSAIFTLTLFFLSGGFALVYQVAWVRAMTLEFGSTTLAVSTVLTVFMGGLGLGAWLVGRRIDRSRMPLATYGALELLLAVYTLLTPLLIRHVMPLFSQLVMDRGDSLLLLSLVRFCAAVLLLGPPTIMMGATLPVLSRFWAIRSPNAGRWAGLLYGINTVGAFAGTAAAGFFLLPRIGLTGTLVLVASCNVVLGLLALIGGWMIERELPVQMRVPGEDSPAEPPRRLAALSPMHLAVLLTGFAALVCEVAWTRTLVLVLGPSTYAFSIVLATFLAGLGLGSAFVSLLLRGRPERARSAFYVIALLAAVAVTASSSLFRHLPPAFLQLYERWALDVRHDRVLLAQVLLSSAVMLVPTLLMGALFPAAARALILLRETAGASVGNLYVWNTAGAIAGSFAAGFGLIPLVGIRGALLAAIAAQVVGGVVAAIGTGTRAQTFWSTTLGLLLLANLMYFAPPWHKQVMTSAMYHYPTSFEGTDFRNFEGAVTGSEELIFYRDGLTATVTVARDRYEPQNIYIATNGKVDGSNHVDMPTQRLSAHWPLLLHPDPKQVAVIGIGTGCTAGSATLHPVEKITLVEIEAAMVQGARHFREDNYNVHENPRVEIRVTDGRLFLNHRRAAFDVIISEPSNPWLAGVSDLFTREFFSYGARALRKGGVFGQWVQLYGMSPENVAVLVRTFNSVFPHVYLVSTIPHADVLMLGSREPLQIDVQRISAALADPDIARDLADERVEVASLEQFLARVRLGPEEVPEFAGTGEMHTDDLPLIAYRAPRDLYRSTAYDNLLRISQYARGAAPYLEMNGMPPEQRKTLLLRLADEYELFVDPDATEAGLARQIAAEQEP